MPKFRCPKWSTSLSVGNDEIDAQHKEFLEKIARVSKLIEDGEAQEIKDAATAMVALLKVHFDTEERIFEATPYPQAAEHAVEHRVLLHIATHARKMIIGSNESKYLRLSLRFLAQSMVEHLMTTDKGYRPYLSPAGNSLPQTEQPSP